MKIRRSLWLLVILGFGSTGNAFFLGSGCQVLLTRELQSLNHVVRENFLGRPLRLVENHLAGSAVALDLRQVLGLPSGVALFRNAERSFQFQLSAQAGDLELVVNNGPMRSFGVRRLGAQPFVFLDESFAGSFVRSPRADPTDFTAAPNSSTTCRTDSITSTNSADTSGAAEARSDREPTSDDYHLMRMAARLAFPFLDARGQVTDIALVISLRPKLRDREILAEESFYPSKVVRLIPIDALDKTTVGAYAQVLPEAVGRFAVEELLRLDPISPSTQFASY